MVFATLSNLPEILFLFSCLSAGCRVSLQSVKCGVCLLCVVGNDRHYKGGEEVFPSTK